MGPNAPQLSPRDLLALLLVGLLWHGLWAWLTGTPKDWDPWYYRSIALRIAEGHGATTPSLQYLPLDPGSLPMPADLHWYPLTSRALVPFVWVWPNGGHLVAGVLFAALWGPLAALLAARLALGRQDALIAGLIASSGGVYLGVLEQTDVFALQGVLYSAGLLALMARAPVGLAVVAALLTLHRNDGLLVALLLALPAGRTGGPAVLAAAAAWAGWSWRCWSVGGEPWATARRISLTTTDYPALFDGAPFAVLTPLDRVVGIVTHWTEILSQGWLAPGQFVLVPFVIHVLLQHRKRPWARAVALTWLALPVLQVAIAPAAATHGTIQRTGAALVPITCALGVIGARHLDDWAQRTRGYPPQLVVGITACLFAGLSVFRGIPVAATQQTPRDCAPLATLPEGAVFTKDVHEVWVRCRRPGVFVTSRIPVEDLQDLAHRHGIVGAWLQPEEESVRDRLRVAFPDATSHGEVVVLSSARPAAAPDGARATPPTREH